MTPTASILKSSDSARRSWWQRLAGAAGAKRDNSVLGLEAELPSISEALLDLAAASLQHCGFHPGDFELQLLEHGLHGQPILLVQVRKASELVWDFASHLETYLLDRMYRRGGFRLERIMFTPTRMADLNLHDARNGVRVAWTSLTRTRHDAADDRELNLTDRAGLNPASAFAANDTRT